MNLSVATLRKLVEVWAGAAVIAMCLCLVAESFTSNLAWLASSYFGGAIFTVNVAVGVGLALFFHAVGVMGRIVREFTRVKFSEPWELGLYWGAMSLLGTFAFASINQAFATTNPVRFVICAIVAAVAGYFSWSTKASRERDLVAESFRKTNFGFRSLRIYLLTWVLAVSVAILCANLSALPSYVDYNGAVWLLLTLLNLVFCTSIGLVTGYVLFAMNAFMLRNYISEGKLRGNKRVLLASRVIQVVGGGAVLAYVLASPTLEAVVAISFGFVISGVAWLATFKRLAADSIED